MNTIKDGDFLVGGGATVAGAGGLTLQSILQYGNAAVMVVNILLAVGGLYLLLLRIRKVRRELHTLKEEE